MILTVLTNKTIAANTFIGSSIFVGPFQGTTGSLISHAFVVVIVVARNVDIAKITGEAYLAFAAVVII